MSAAPAVAQRDALLAAAGRLRAEVQRRIVGQEHVLDEILMSLLAGGHALLVGVPGLAKTLMVRSLAEAIQLEFRRIQFTPDLVPSDITGTEILEEDSATGARSFRFVRGPGAGASRGRPTPARDADADKRGGARVSSSWTFPHPPPERTSPPAAPRPALHQQASTGGPAPAAPPPAPPTAPPISPSPCS